ncbi:hypothetical protein [Cellulomonas cellasea]|uniref:hypothetical protein n=1 Tax=Cellulomonas cellasea TaxID=43670 RepID=UPI0011436A15|nr:hypothetical protein [Cellulomonas cellasea]
MLVVALELLRRSGSFAERTLSPVVLLGAVVVSAIPVTLLLIDRVAAGAGTLRGPGGFEVSFAGAALAAERTTNQKSIAANLGSIPGQNVADSGGGILRTLEPLVGAEVGIVDLEEGSAWWQTRLLVLLSGATRVGYPRLIVFVATIGGRPRQLLGWGVPRNLLRAQLAHCPDALAAAFHRGRADALRWMISYPIDERLGVTPWLPSAQVPFLNEPVGPSRSHRELVPERLLLLQVASLENGGTPSIGDDLFVSEHVARRLFGSVWCTAAVDRHEEDQKWQDAVLSGTDPYLAVTDEGRYSAMIDRQAAVNAVIVSLVSPDGEHAGR